MVGDGNDMEWARTSVLGGDVGVRGRDLVDEEVLAVLVRLHDGLATDATNEGHLGIVSRGTRRAESLRARDTVAREEAQRGGGDGGVRVSDPTRAGRGNERERRTRALIREAEGRREANIALSREEGGRRTREGDASVSAQIGRRRRSFDAICRSS